MKISLLPFIILFSLFSSYCFSQEKEVIQNSLDSLKVEKSILVERIEQIELLEKEYTNLLGDVIMNSSNGEFFSITVGTTLYKESGLNTSIAKLKRGDKIQLKKREKYYCFVSYNGIDGYVYPMALSDNPIEKPKPTSTDIEIQNIDLKPLSKGEIVEHTYYTISYSEPNEQAEWVFYKLTDQMLMGTASRTDNFRADNLVKTYSANPNDYSGSGYDRGHLCPAGDMAINTVAMSESFYMSNMSPQNPSFNRGIWKKLEGTVRNWAMNEKEIYVTTGPVFRDNLGTLPNCGVTVPGYYYKVVYDPTDEVKMIALVLPNKKGVKQLPDYVVSVDYVESITGIDFFSGLPDDIENKLESQLNSGLWEFEEYNISRAKEGEATQCLGIAKSTGQRCRNKTTNENGYCYMHQSQIPGNEQNKEVKRLTTSVQCKGTTKSGTRCKNKTLNANGYCHLHQSQVSSSGNTVIKSTTKSTKSSYSGSKTIHTGPRGGKYYINKNGNKTYIKK